MKDYKNFKKKNFQNKFWKKEERTFEKPRAIEISELNSDLFNKSLEVSGIIEKIHQTGGPTIFTITDGTGTLALKGFVGIGQRAFPEINENDSIKASIILNEFEGELEGEIKKISKLSSEESKIIEEKIRLMQEKRASVNIVPFLVKSNILEKLKDSIIKAAFEIRLAIIQNRPIIVRHHNDTDGYSAGYSLEKAILPLIEKEHGSEKARYEFFMRAPSPAPFYEIDDSIKDTALSLRNAEKFSNKMPLVIIADNGSTPEDLFAIKHGKVHGMQFIVVDHHYSGMDVISKEVLVHINPWLVEEDGSKFSAGMLCAELARLINNNENQEIVPALAGIADKIELNNPEIMKDYIKIAEKEGYSRKLLIDISKVIDFVSAKIRFMEAREYIGVIFGEPRDKQKELVSIMEPYITKLEEKALLISKENVITEKIKEKTLQIIEIEKTFPGFGFYPKPGKCVSLIHDYGKEKGNIKNLVTIGVMNTAMTFRASDEANFSMHDLIAYLNKNSPNSFVEGGGHKNAGSINFLPNKQQEILELVKKFIKEK